MFSMIYYIKQCQQIMNNMDIKKINNRIELEQIYPFLKQDNLKKLIESDDKLQLQAIKNTLIMFDSTDDNSAFLEEWFNNHKPKKTSFDVVLVKSSDEIKNFIKEIHGLFNLPIEDENKKFEIFLIIIKDGEFYWKSDDYDVIHEQTIKDAIEVLEA